MVGRMAIPVFAAIAAFTCMVISTGLPVVCRLSLTSLLEKTAPASGQDTTPSELVYCPKAGFVGKSVELLCGSANNPPTITDRAAIETKNITVSFIELSSLNWLNPEHQN